MGSSCQQPFPQFFPGTDPLRRDAAFWLPLELKAEPVYPAGIQGRSVIIEEIKRNFPVMAQQTFLYERIVTPQQLVMRTPSYAPVSQ